MSEKNPRNLQEEAERALDTALQLGLDVINAPEVDRFVVLPFEPQIAARVFTPERMRLLLVICEHGPFESISALAEKLHRDPSRVSRDVQDLEGLGLIEVIREGKQKRIQAYASKITMPISLVSSKAAAAEIRTAVPSSRRAGSQESSQPFLLVDTTIEEAGDGQEVVEGYEIEIDSEGNIVAASEPLLEDSEWAPLVRHDARKKDSPTRMWQQIDTQLTFG